MEKIVLHKGYEKDKVELTFWHTFSDRHSNGTTIALSAKAYIMLERVIREGIIYEDNLGLKL